MKRIFGLLLAFWVGSSSLYAQDTCRFFFSSFNNIEFGSDRLPLNFASDFYRGGYLDSASKTDAIVKLGSRNVSGYLASASVIAGVDADFNRFGWFVKAEYNSMAMIRYSSSLFQIAFFGNSYLAGDTAILNPFSLFSSSWVSIPSGIVFRTGREKKMQWMLGIGPVAAINYASIESDRLKLFTADDGSFIDLDMAWDFQRTPANPAFTGFGGTAFLRVSCPESNGMPEWYLAASAPSFVYFNNKSVLSTRDTAIHFTGADINDISMFDSEIQTTLDELENDFSIDGDTSDFSAWLPAHIEAGFKGNYGKICWAFDTKIVALEGYMPMLRISLAYPISNSVNLILPIRYGGFGGFNTGFGCALDLPCGLYAGIYADQLLSLAFPSYFTASGFALSIGFKN